MGEQAEIKLLLTSTLTAVLNSLASANIKLYELGNEINTKLIERCRLLTEQVKKLFNDLQLEYSMYQLYNITEAQLEYFEAKSHLNANNMPLANMKILHATSRIETIKNAKKAHLNIQFTLIKVKIDELRKKIFTIQGII